MIFIFFYYSLLALISSYLAYYQIGKYFNLKQAFRDAWGFAILFVSLFNYFSIDKNSKDALYLYVNIKNSFNGNDNYIFPLLGESIGKILAFIALGFIGALIYTWCSKYFREEIVENEDDEKK